MISNLEEKNKKYGINVIYFKSVNLALSKEEL